MMDTRNECDVVCQVGEERITIKVTARRFGRVGISLNGNGFGSLTCSLSVIVSGRRDMILKT